MVANVPNYTKQTTLTWLYSIWSEATQHQFFEGGCGSAFFPCWLLGFPWSFQQSFLKWPGLPQWWQTLVMSTAPNTIGELPLYLELLYWLTFFHPTGAYVRRWDWWCGWWWCGALLPLCHIMLASACSANSTASSNVSGRDIITHCCCAGFNPCKNRCIATSSSTRRLPSSSYKRLNSVVKWDTLVVCLKLKRRARNFMSRSMSLNCDSIASTKTSKVRSSKARRLSLLKLRHQVKASPRRKLTKNLHARSPVPNPTESMYCYITYKKLWRFFLWPSKVIGFSNFTSLGCREGPRALSASPIGLDARVCNG